MRSSHTDIRKITVNLPASLIDPLLSSSKKGQTEIIREALEQYKRRQAYQALRNLRGKVKFLMTYEEMKELRD